MRAPAASRSSSESTDSRPAAPHFPGHRWRVTWVLFLVFVLSVFLVCRVEADVAHGGGGGATASEPQTITLQAGTRDTYLDSQNPNKPWGLDNRDSLKLRRGVYPMLLWFDLSALPEGAEVLSATLGLYTWWTDSQSPIQVEAYGVLRPWVDVEATWNESRTGESWSAPGCSGAGTDRSAAPVALQTIAGANRWQNWDVTGLVRSWAQGVADNQGLLLAASPGSLLVSYNFRSADWRTAGERPRLVITYTLAADAATPTATATSPAPTTSATPSDTATSQPTATLTETPTGTTSAVPSASPTASPSPVSTGTIPPATWRTPVANSLYPYPEQRIGFVADTTYGIDVAGLHGGVGKLGARAPYDYERSLGLDFVTVFDVYYQIYNVPTPAEYQARIRQMVAANPDYAWFIGNEPEALCRGARPARVYAEIYHDMYYLIKGVDPTAIVGIGGVVVPSRFRFQWLDQTLSDYRMLYAEPMPVDVWNIHNLLLSECPGACGCFPDKLPWCSTCCSGGYMPVGQEGACGQRIYRTQQDQVNVQMFEDLIWDMRRWMATREEARGKPLIITEMGVLADRLREEDPGSIIPHEMVNQFMSSVFDFMLTATDPEIGCVTDGGRLVQRWMWYSLDHSPCCCIDNTNGSLFCRGSATDFGVNFRNYTAHFLPTLPISIFYQRGWTGYTADTETTLVWNSTERVGGLPFVKIQVDGTRKALLQFQVPAMPANVEVITATLSLRSLLRSGVSTMRVDCYGVKRPWDVSAANWISATSSAAWEQPGCAGPRDREQAPVSSVTVTALDTLYTWDVTQLAQQWIGDPSSNHGVLLQATGAGSGFYTFVSSDMETETTPGLAWTYRERPKLELLLGLRQTTPTPTATMAVSATPTATAIPTATAMPTATATLTASPPATGTATPSPTRQPSATPTASATVIKTPVTPPRCVSRTDVWSDEFDNAALPLWQRDMGGGTAQVNASIMRLQAPDLGSDRFPLLWSWVQFPDPDYVLDIRFRFSAAAPYGTTIGIGSAGYDGARFAEGNPPPAGIEDVLKIHRSERTFRISLRDQIYWDGSAMDSAWHVVHVRREGAVLTLSVDGQTVGSVSSDTGTPRTIFLGNPAIQPSAGAWTPLEVDYVHVYACRLWGSDRLWLPILLRGAW